MGSAWAEGDIDRTHPVTMLAKRTPRIQHTFATDHIHEHANGGPTTPDW